VESPKFRTQASSITLARPSKSAEQEQAHALPYGELFDQPAGRMPLPQSLPGLKGALSVAEGAEPFTQSGLRECRRKYTLNPIMPHFDFGESTSLAGLPCDYNR